ncbi:uncharacterized protein TNCV_633671 [Trichonephila clavipes]|nr:uncharacterized protein TNCV_633671 [Trichonephila clavipes]
MVPRINTKGARWQCPPHTIKRVVGAVRLNLDSSLKSTWFHSAAVQFPRARHLSKRRRRWVGVKGSSRNGRRDRKCSSAMCLRMVPEDTGGPSEGTAYAWMAIDEVVHVHFLRHGGLIDDWSVEGVLSLVFL